MQTRGWLLAFRIGVLVYAVFCLLLLASGLGAILGIPILRMLFGSFSLGDYIVAAMTLGTVALIVLHANVSNAHDEENPKITTPPQPSS